MSCEMELVKKLEERLARDFDPVQIQRISENLIKVLSDFDVAEKCRDVAMLDSVNDKLLKQYCACLYVDGKSEKTIYQYRRTLIRLADAIRKDYPEMGVYDIRYFLACEKERGVSNRSTENSRSNISAFFQWMFREEIILKNPCLNIKPIKYDDVIRRPFSDVEIDSLREACKTSRERALIELLLSSGIRVSELADLKISDVDSSSLEVHIRCGKGGKGRITYVTSVAMRHLLTYWNERKEDGEAAFYNVQHKPLNAGGVRMILKAVAKSASVDNVHPHRFRRTFASGLASRGMDVQEIQKLLGHSNINTTMEYVYTDDQKISSSYKQYIA